MTVNFKVLKRVDKDAFHKLLGVIRKLTGEIVSIDNDNCYTIVRVDFVRGY